MQYDFNLVANGGQVIDVSGKFFKYKSGTGAIRIKTNGGGYVDLLPGQGVWNTNFSTLTVSDISGGANKGVILAGNFDFHDDRIAGTVDVVDGGKTRTMADTAKIGWTYQGAVAAQYAFVQLWNPAASGKNIYVEQVSFFSTGAMAAGINLRTHNAALTALSGNPQSKKAGGVASAAELRGQNTATIMGTTTFCILDKVQKLFKFTEPMQLPPGYGLILFNGTINEDIGATFELFEDAV